MKDGGSFSGRIIFHLSDAFVYIGLILLCQPMLIEASLRSLLIGQCRDVFEVSGLVFIAVADTILVIFLF